MAFYVPGWLYLSAFRSYFGLAILVLKITEICDRTAQGPSTWKLEHPEPKASEGRKNPGPAHLKASQSQNPIPQHNCLCLYYIRELNCMD